METDKDCKCNGCREKKKNRNWYNFTYTPVAPQMDLQFLADDDDDIFPSEEGF